jgi:hypothetical protein
MTICPDSIQYFLTFTSALTPNHAHIKGIARDHLPPPPGRVTTGWRTMMANQRKFAAIATPVPECTGTHNEGGAGGAVRTCELTPIDSLVHTKYIRL